MSTRPGRGADHGPPWGFIALLGAASGLSAFGMSTVVPILPMLGGALQADYSALQFVVSAYLFGLALFQPLQGLLCDRFGRRPVILGGFAVFFAASLLASVTESLPALIAARLLQSMGASVATIVPRAIVRDSLAPEPAAVAMAFISAVMGLSPVIAPLVGAGAASTVGWRAVFWLHAAAAAALLVLLAWKLRESRPAQTGAMDLRHLLGGFSILLRDRVFLANSLVYSFISSASFVFITIGADLFDRLYGMPVTRFGMLWALLALGYAAGSAAAGALSRRFGSQPVMRRGLHIALVAAVIVLTTALSAAPPLWAFVTGLGVLVFAAGLVSPLALAGCTVGHPERAGVAAGLSSSIAMLASMAFAIAAGVVYDGSAGPAGLLLALACVLAWLSPRISR